MKKIRPHARHDAVPGTAALFAQEEGRAQEEETKKKKGGKRKPTA
jgi:hypothetical protein